MSEEGEWSCRYDCARSHEIIFISFSQVSEDCLYLNVFVPLSVKYTSPPLKLLPVMLWIHGGDFIAGSASKALYDCRYISNFTNTVVVSVAYRLGETRGQNTFIITLPNSKNTHVILLLFRGFWVSGVREEPKDISSGELWDSGPAGSFDLGPEEHCSVWR